MFISLPDRKHAFVSLKQSLNWRGTCYRKSPNKTSRLKILNHNMKKVRQSALITKGY